MCDACNKWASGLQTDYSRNIKIMPMPDAVDAPALARFRKAQGITDTRKLDAMLPAWIKAHNRACAAPSKRAAFVPGQPAKFPPIESGAEYNARQNANSARNRRDTFYMQYADGSKGAIL